MRFHEKNSERPNYSKIQVIDSVSFNLTVRSNTNKNVLFFKPEKVYVLFISETLLLQISGIDKILPCMKIDDYLFEPCGYSMNGILRNESNDFGLV